MSNRVVVVGADAAGMSAASQAKRLDPDLEVVALDRGAYASYSACGIPYWVAGDVEHVDQLIARTREEPRRRGIDLRLRHEVTGLDVPAGKVRVRDHERGADYALAYDSLVLA